MSTILKFPLRKKGATPAEFFREIADLAEERPELFLHYVAIWEPAPYVDSDIDLAASEGVTLAVLNTLLDMAKMDVLAGIYCAED